MRLSSPRRADRSFDPIPTEMKSTILPLLFCLGLPAAAQVPRPVAPDPSLSATTAMAARATRPPVVDGFETDEIWQSAPPIDQFRQFVPAENGEPTYRTVLR